MARSFKRDRKGRFASKSGGGGKSAAYYGKGRKGRKAAKRATYGRKKDGLSISQQRRRRTRSNRRGANVAKAAAVVGTIAAIASTQEGKVLKNQASTVGYHAYHAAKFKYKLNQSKRRGN